MKAIKNGKIIMPQGILENQVLVFDEVIRSIQVEVPEDCEVIDARGMYVSQD